jgi:hypothetical protein
MHEHPPEFALPPGEATLLCTCGFQTEPFCFIEELYRCRNCKTVDRPLKTPFRYVTPNCTVCDTQFATTDRIRARSMRARYLNSKEFGAHPSDSTRCPRCGEESLAVNSLGIDYQCVETNTVAPSPGETIHARMISSVGEFYLSSPRLAFAFSHRFRIANAEAAEIGNGHHEFRIIEINDESPRLVLEYIRRLSPSEWDWFI